MKIYSKWSGTCPTCRTRNEIEYIKQERSEQNPYRVGKVCGHCRKDIVFFTRQDLSVEIRPGVFQTYIHDLPPGRH